MVKSVYMVFIFCAASVLIAGCGGERPAAGAAPDAQVRAVSSDELEGKIGAGGAPVTMVHIWATWCPPCIEEFPELVELGDRFETDDLNIILLSADNPSDADKVAEFLDENSSPWGSLIAEKLDEEFMSVFGSEWGGAIPATFFFGRDGTLLKWWSGARNRSEYVQAIDRLLESAETNE